MFDALSDKILGSFKKLRGQARITEDNIQEAIRDIRMSFLEADVHFKVVKTFIDRVKEKAIGTEVIKGISAGQKFVQIVHDELVQILGGQAEALHLKGQQGQPAVVMLVGLQGAGKTTSVAKLAKYIRKQYQKKVGIVPVDIYRPGAILQAQTLGKQNDIPVFPSRPEQKPEEIVEQARRWATDSMIEVLLLDTAGRLQIDENLMQELERLKALMSPSEILLVADAMLGQQSVDVATGFHQRLILTGLILTKVDGDARGGAALSIREATGIPIKFLGVGEKADALEVFHPDRLASRILDRGDVLSLVEKAQEVIDVKQAEKAARKMQKNQFTVEDFLEQIQMLKKLGGMESLLKMLPGMGQAMKQMKDMTPPDAEIKKIEAIIRSMTVEERNKHEILNGSRRLRIANGSGTSVQDVNRFVKQFDEARKMMTQMMKMGLGKGFGGGFGGLGGGLGGFGKGFGSRPKGGGGGSGIRFP